MNKNKSVPLESLRDWVQIDQGHFGSVYKVKHTDLKLTVAVKKLKGNVSQNLKALLSEAEKMDSASASPFVIRLYGILGGSSKGPPGIVMEYMEYGSLCTLMEKGEIIPWALKFRILYEVALGMNWLHTLSPPLLHLDLKTKNVLINEELHIKITDFGLSKYTSGSSICGPDECDGVGGTLEYMPPEAFQEGYQPSKSTDIYSFAILCAVVLKGEDPYPANKSALIRELVPRGQRPCLQSLENESSVKSLNMGIQFTKQCWDNDRYKRPSFSECCNQWEVFNSAYDKTEIKSAVRKVQDSMDSYGRTTESSHTKGAESVNTRDMPALLEKFGLLRYSERSPPMQQAVPVMSPQKTTSQNPRVPKPRFPQASQQWAAGPSHGPYYPPYPQYTGFPSYWPYQGYNYPPAVYPSHQSPVPSTTINIHGSTGPLQIGDNNVMHSTSQRPSSNSRLFTPRPGANITRHNYAPTTQPRPTYQPQPTMLARQPFLGQTSCKQETKNKDQPTQLPPVQLTAMRGSQQGQANNSCNTQTETQSILNNSKECTENTGH